MSLSDELSAIAAEERRLAERRVLAAAKRKEEIAALAERCGVLEISDEFIAGALLALVESISSEGGAADLATRGRSFLGAKRGRKPGTGTRSDKAASRSASKSAGASA